MSRKYGQTKYPSIVFCKPAWIKCLAEWDDPTCFVAIMPYTHFVNIPKISGKSNHLQFYARHIEVYSDGPTDNKSALVARAWHRIFDGASHEIIFHKTYCATWHHEVYHDHYVTVFVFLRERLNRASCVHNTANLHTIRRSFPYTQAIVVTTINTAFVIDKIGVLLEWHSYYIMALNKRLNQWNQGIEPFLWCTFRNRLIQTFL